MRQNPSVQHIKQNWGRIRSGDKAALSAILDVSGSGRGQSNAYIDGKSIDVGADIFKRGLCLPSDNKMKPEEQDVVIEIIKRCFNG